MTMSVFHSITSKWRLQWLAGFLMLSLAACSTTPPQPNYPGPGGPGPVVEGPEEPDVGPEEDAPLDEPEEEETPEILADSGLVLPHMKDREVRQIALLLPFSASSDRARDEAASMLRAAELALFEREQADIVLIAKDTGGTESGARNAAQAALDEGADVILGPLFGRNVSAVAPLARAEGVPVVAFSTDQEVAGNGVYLLSFPPAEEVDYVVRYVARQGARNFAYLGPSNSYGRAVEAALRGSTASLGRQVVVSESYSGGSVNDMTAPARAVANRKDAIDTVMLPEGGTRLLSLAPLLPYYDLDPRRVQFIGTGQWNDTSIAREPALQGGLFAGPSPEARADFENLFASRFGDEPSGLASLAFDGFNLSAWALDGDKDELMERLTDPDGFYGADGLVRLRPDGLPERGLAIFEVRSGAFVVVEPAPVTFEGAGF